MQNWRKTHVFKYIFMKNFFFGLQTTVVDGFNVLLSFLAEKWYRTIMKLPQKASFRPKHAKFDKKSPFGVSGGQGFPPKIPPSFTEHLPKQTMNQG